MIEIASHDRLDLGALNAHFDAPLSELPSPDWLLALLRADPAAPLAADDAVRVAVRDLLRGAGYKPTGRGKPASEYLARAAAEGSLRSINLAADAGNAVSLASGLPVSVVDLAKTRAPLRVALGRAGDTYVFNASGQVIDVEGLLCLFDAEGPCANAVKDAQRTKTTGETREILCLVWGTRALGDRTARAVEWFRTLLARAGARLSEP